MATFTYTDVDVKKDYRNDGMTETWIVTFSLHLDGDTYAAHREYEHGEYGENAFSLLLDGVDLTDSDQWPTDDIPHAVKALAYDEELGYADFGALTDWIDEEFFSPIWEAVYAAEQDAMAKVDEKEGSGEV